jgi:hypothetical protein
VRNPRFLLSLGLVTAIVLLWRSMGSAAGEMQRYVSLQYQWHTKLYRLPCVQVGSNC